MCILNGYLQEEVYVEEPTIFDNSYYLDHVLKLLKGLYGLKEALKPWYERLSKFLLKNDFERGQIDMNVQTKGDHF